MRVVLRVAGLVEERPPVVGAAHRLDDAHDVPSLCVAESDPRPRAEELVGLALVELLRRVEDLAALVGERVELEAEVAIEVGVGVGAEPRNRLVQLRYSVDMDRVDVLLREAVAGLLEALPPRPVLLVRDRRAGHPVRGRLAVDARLELRFEGRALLGVLARQLGEVVLGREPPELRDAAVTVGRLAEGLSLLERRELGIPLVEGLQVERLLVPGVVEVVLLVELRDEAIDALAVSVQLSAGRRGARHGRRIDVVRLQAMSTARLPAAKPHKPVASGRTRIALRRARPESAFWLAFRAAYARQHHLQTH